MQTGQYTRGSGIAGGKEIMLYPNKNPNGEQISDGLHYRPYAPPLGKMVYVYHVGIRVAKPTYNIP